MEYVKAKNTTKQPKTTREQFSFKILKILLNLKGRKGQW